MEPERAQALHPYLHEQALPAADSHEVIVNSIAATTATGHIAHVELDTAECPTGVKIPHKEMAELEFNGTLRQHEWNYLVKTRHTRYGRTTPATKKQVRHHLD